MTVEELASYYRAAVEFIDPRLTDDCPVEDICAAAQTRQRALATHRSRTAEQEMEKIRQALQFIQRIHPEIQCCLLTEQELAEPQAGAAQALSQAQANTGTEVAETQALAPDVVETPAIEAVEAKAPAPEAIEMALPAPEAVAVETVEVEAALAKAVTEEAFDGFAAASNIEPATPDSELDADSPAPAIFIGAAEELLQLEEDDEEFVELRIGNPQHAVSGAAADAAETEASAIETADAPAVEADSAGAPAAIVDDSSADQSRLAVDADPLAGESVQAISADTAGITAAEAESEADAQAALAAAMAAAPETAVDKQSRHQFIEELRSRRSRNGELQETEAVELLSELNAEDGERIDSILQRLPDVQSAMQSELAREEARQQPLDFRSMMERAGARGLELKPAARRRIRTAEIMQRPRPEHRIPEEAAAPIVLGMLMIGWQFLAALLCGFALCRILVWPWGTVLSTLSPLRVVLACTVLLGCSALCALWFRHYRLRTHRLALPVHITALSILALLLPWQLRSIANPYLSSPPLLLWGLFIAAWLVATVACLFHDLRVPPLHQSEDGADGVRSAKPAVPQAG